MLGKKDDAPDSAHVEETAWLDRALPRAETWSHQIDRAMFGDLGASPPRWWPAYENAPAPI
ncbi:MAG: hypothetical protein ABI551_06215 [Polyangiaceae bacterium]